MARRSRNSKDLIASEQGARQGFSYDELVSLVSKYFCRGHSMSEIREILAKDDGISLNREEPWQMVSYAARKGWIRYVAPAEEELEQRLSQRYRQLSVKVVRTGAADDVSYHVAQTLLEMIRTRHQLNPDAEAVHIGFAGGSSLRRTAKILSDLLCRIPSTELPKRLVFHAMVAGFHIDNPRPDPNSFFTFLENDPALPVQTSFVALLAPGIVRSSLIRGLKAIEDIKSAYDRASELDIIVTSAGGHWQQGHSALYDMYLQRSPRSLKLLDRAGVIGDLMWRPISRSGPCEVDTDIRAMTLIELTSLPNLIARGKQVLLLMGPCGQCGGPKSDVLSAILEMRPLLITHLVVDSRSAAGAPF